MRATLTLIICCLVAIGCGRKEPAVSPASAERNYDVNGVVREVDPKELSVEIEHEDIPGFMPSMTMPFKVKMVDVLQGVAADDKVKFHLIVTDTDSWVSHIDVLEQSTNAPSLPVPSLVAEEQPLPNGALVPDFKLTDQDGRMIHVKDYRGKAVLLTFIFTRCPLPNYCPLMSRNFASLQGDLRKQYGDKFHLISVSFDPEHDNPATLKEYATHFTSDLRDWSFATGTHDEIKRVTGLFGCVYTEEGGSITHNMRTALIDPHGRLVHVWKSNVWTEQEVMDMAHDILRQPHG